MQAGVVPLPGSEEVPAWHFLHPRGEPAVEYWPIKQLVHAEVVPPPKVELVPAAQGRQPKIEPAVEYLPTAQLVHAEDVPPPATEVEPAGQGKHREAPGEEKDPLVQLLQEEKESAP